MAASLIIVKGIPLKNSNALGLTQKLCYYNQVLCNIVLYNIIYISCHSTLIKLIVHIASGDYIVHCICSIATCTVYVRYLWLAPTFSNSHGLVQTGHVWASHP